MQTLSLKLFYQFASPKQFYRIAARVYPWLLLVSCLSLAYGFITGLFIAPTDFQQGEGFRIMYVHVPCAFLSLMIYGSMTTCAITRLVWKIKLADDWMKASIPLGMIFTFLALVTGSLWGKPMWGTWWIWDARLTSELILLFIYIGLFAMSNSLGRSERAAKAIAIVVLIASIDLPIIHFSVSWWNTLHQGASLSLLSRPTIAGSMLHPLIAMMIAMTCFYFAMALRGSQSEVLIRKRFQDLLDN